MMERTIINDFSGFGGFDKFNHMYRYDGSSGLGCLWMIGWLFTIGYLKLSFWQGVLGIVIWPYYLGKHYHKSH